MTARSRSWVLLTGVSAVLATSLSAAVLVTAHEPTQLQAAQRPAQVTPAPERTSPATRAFVESKARATSAMVRRHDRLESKLTTWAEFAAVYANFPYAKSVILSQEVWVVAVAGDFRPQFAKSRTGQSEPPFPWGIIVYDRNGNAIATFAGRDQNWPGFFDALPDRGGS